VFRKLITKKRALVLGVVAALAVAGIAIAYWTTTGSGTGSGSVKSDNGTLVLHGTITNALTPGSTSPVTFTADNAGSSSLRVEDVKAVVTNSKEPGCKSADFTIADTAENQTIAAKSSEVPLGKNGSITMADTAVNQDECKSAVITLTLSSN
jgi:hypothetical protein